MQILVTGSQGTLGKKLVAELNRRGHHVVGCDLHHGEKNEIRADVAEKRQVDNVFAQVAPEIVFHLAAEFGRNNGQHYYEQLWKSNVIGTRNIIEACTQSGAHLVFASSSEAYGDTAESGRALHEDDLLTQVPNFHNEYALSKWTNEKQIQIASQNSSLKATTLRFFNAYGPGEEYNNYRSVVCLFIYRLLHDLPITVYEDYHRVFMYVSDWANTVAGIANLTVLNNISTIPSHLRVFNIGGQEYVSIETLVEKLKVLIPETESAITLLPKEQANITNKRPNNERAKVWLGHNPAITLDQGLPWTVRWMRERYGKPECYRFPVELLHSSDTEGIRKYSLLNELARKTAGLK
jgi:dTDP-glucose 4,6-dehydratase